MKRCRHCDTPITLLTSQKNGNLDTCLKCAIDRAPFLYYTLKRRSELLAAEVICQRHYREEKEPGRSMGPLADREIGAGYVQTVVPYSGDHQCATCEAEADRRKGTAA